MTGTTEFDVVICGGGLAGLTLARQLRLELPDLSVAVIDRLTRPLPEAAFKVGESSFELGAYYFGRILKLEQYFCAQHLFKLGLRFFMGNSWAPIEERSELGPSIFPLIPAYQIDRGRLENDLRQFIEEMGVTLFEGTLIDDICLAKGDEQHTVKCRSKGTGNDFSLASRWVVDALGRRRLLQTQLGLKRDHGHWASAAWWRYKTLVDVDDLAAENAYRWRSDSIEKRFFSTNHLMDKGYWVWLIPLSSGGGSVGIVTDETIHPQHTYGQSYEMALEWLHLNEPVLWKHIRHRQPLDFLSIKNCSYASAQVFSTRRWSCVGEAGFFLDPFYSSGSDFIAIENTITIELIRREVLGALTEKAVDDFNKLVLKTFFPIGQSFYQGTYCTLGHPQIFIPKFTWDLALVWAFTYQIFLQGLLLNPTDVVFALGEQYRQLNDRVQQLFIDWSKSAPPRPIFVKRGDLTRMRFIQLLALELATRRSPEQTLDVARKNLDRFEELAQVFFWQALEECYPENALLKERPWINAWHMVLDPKKWTESGMFNVDSPPRPLNEMRDNFAGIFAPQSLRDRLIYDLPFNIMHWHKGFVHYHIVPPLLKRFVTSKPALWLRKIFVKDYPTGTTNN